MIVNVIDTRSNARREQVYNAAARSRSGTRVARIPVAPDHSLGSIVEAIIRRIDHPRSIWLLRIMAHGNRGWIQLGADGLSAANAHEFEPLREYMTPNGIGIAIHSCGSASDSLITRPPDGWFEEWTADKDEHFLQPGSLSPDEDGEPVGGRGVDFLRQLSISAGDVQVRGGVNAQIPDTSFRFEGPSVAVRGRSTPVLLPGAGNVTFDTRLVT